MGIPIIFFSVTLLSAFMPHSHFINRVACDPTLNGNGRMKKRESLEISFGGGGIIIGGGGFSPPAPPSQTDCPPPPPPEICPPPLSPPPLPPPPLSPPPLPPPPLSPPPLPPPPPKVGSTAPLFESSRIQTAYKAIAKFRGLIKDDPMQVTKTWNGTDVCKTYKGIRCATYPKDKKKAVYGLDFSNYGFNGHGDSLPVDVLIDGIPELTFIHANSNNFTGTLTASILKLPYLYELDFSNNKLSGPFPSAILSARNLTFVDLRFNMFSGRVPPGIFTLDLDFLFINNNPLAPQQLPDTLCTPRALFISLANSRYVGPIPPNIGEAAERLVEILLLNNSLSGCLPTGIGQLVKLRYLNLGQNRLTGPIPLSFACLRKMQSLSLAENRMYGIVPEMVCQLPLLFNFSLAFNYFTEAGPECRKLIASGRLDLRMNCVLDLPYQRSRAECAAFYSKQLPCPQESYMRTHIPCSVPAEEPSSDATQLSALHFNPVSYGALTPHHSP